MQLVEAILARHRIGLVRHTWKEMCEAIARVARFTYYTGNPDEAVVKFASMSPDEIFCISKTGELWPVAELYSWIGPLNDFLDEIGAPSLAHLRPVPRDRKPSLKIARRS